MNAQNKWNQITNTFYIVSALAALLVIPGCSGGGGGGTLAPTNANPTGYYDVTGGTATFDDGTGSGTLGGAGGITDFQGMVNGNRFIAMSVAQNYCFTR